MLSTARHYPPEPQAPRAVALGNLYGARPPSAGEVKLAMFLFGAPPAPVLAVATPTGLAVDDDVLLICDTTLDAILRYNHLSGELAIACREPVFDHPFAIAIAANGDRLVCDRQGVWRCDPISQPQRAYPLESAPYQPTGVLEVGGTVWVANSASHRIEVFDLESGAHLRSIGQQGNGPGEFALPRSMARTPDGHVCIVDMLNNRVQVLDADGTWVRDIGEPGDHIGAFGRPKDVAVGPDGTIFVTDAFSQRVHAFAPNGEALLAFGEPGSEAGALAMPNGVAISQHPPTAELDLPADATPEYFVLVGEQLDRPGIRAYAWLGDGQSEPGGRLPDGLALDWKPRLPESAAINPHWHADRCLSCHKSEGVGLSPIAPAAVDPLCLSCHDGEKAFADPHPIGRPAVGELVVTPDDWPTVNGMITCLTCHDIRRHCAADAQRPASNVRLLRSYDPQRPLAYCSTCHSQELGRRFSPHRQRDATGKVRDDACFFCHTQRPDIPADGRRRFEPLLRSASSALCLNCHVKHWDLSPLGHVDRPITPRIRQWMLMRELRSESDADEETLARMANQTDRDPARLPLGEGKVTCYSCHNPHYAGLFPPNSELGALATHPQDRASALRTDWIDLCSECHQR